MKLIVSISLFSLAILVSSLPINKIRRAVDQSLVPNLGFEAGLNPTGSGDCDGAVNGADGNPVKIPCTCPPDSTTFLKSLNANVEAGFAVNNPGVAISFPEDDSKESQLTRMQAFLVTLQNLEGPGVGCPAASTTLLAQQKEIQKGDEATAEPAPVDDSKNADPVVAPAESTPEVMDDGGIDPKLIPDLGAKAGVNPTGTGDCDGAVNGADGNPIKVPCSCPPDEATYIEALNANVAAGFAVNNPTVAISFPTDDTPEAESARITAALITLQNLEGPGVGCPGASTTLIAQQKAL